MVTLWGPAPLMLDLGGADGVPAGLGIFSSCRWIAVNTVLRDWADDPESLSCCGAVSFSATGRLSCVFWATSFVGEPRVV